MSYYLIEDIDKIHPDARFGYDGQIGGPFKTKREALRWLKRDAEVTFEGSDSYEFDSGLQVRDYFGNWGLVKLDQLIRPIAQAKVTIKLEESDGN